MKTVFLFLLMGVSVLSCKKLDKKTQFDIESTSQSTIPSVIGIDLPFDLPTPTITTNIEQEMEENNSRKDLIEYAALKELEFTITSPATADFDFLNEVEIFIRAEGIEQKKIAEVHSIPETGLKIIKLDVVKNVDLQNYIKADKYYLDITVKTDKINLQEISLDIYSKVFVDAKILGI